MSIRTNTCITITGDLRHKALVYHILLVETPAEYTAGSAGRQSNSISKYLAAVISVILIITRFFKVCHLLYFIP